MRSRGKVDLKELPKKAAAHLYQSVRRGGQGEPVFYLPSRAAALRAKKALLEEIEDGQRANPSEPHCAVWCGLDPDHLGGDCWAVTIAKLDAIDVDGALEALVRDLESTNWFDGNVVVPSRALAEAVEERLRVDPSFADCQIFLGAAQPIDPNGEGAFLVNIVTLG